MIEILGLTFTYAGHPTPLFDHFTWRVERGEFWSVIGPSGCGKSTLLHLIVGVRAANAGEILVNGEQVPRKKNRGKTGLVLQDYGLVPWATVRENVELGLRIRGFYRQGDNSSELSLRGVQATMPSPPPPPSPASRGRVREGAPRNDTERVDFWLQRFGIESLRDKYPAQISGGQRQRAAIARTLVLEPDVLLMDEPFSALDAPTRENLEQLTLDLQAETKMTTVFVTHNIEEAVTLGRKILVLGTPPQRMPLRCVHNPGAGRPGYHDEPEFFAQTRRLREMLNVKREG